MGLGVFAAITSELRGKWEDNKRSSREDIDVVRWGQLKRGLQPGKQKVLHSQAMHTYPNYAALYLIQGLKKDI